MEPSVEDAVRQLFTLPPSETQGRGRLVGTAMTLFYEHGITPVGLDWILDEAGVSKTTFYKHFSSKSELVVAAIQERDAWQRAAWRKAVRLMCPDRDPRCQILAVFEVLRMVMQEPAFNGCQFINATVEFPNRNDPVHQAAAAHKRFYWEWFLDLAEQAGTEEPRRIADACSILFEGAIIFRQSHGRDDAGQAALPGVRELVASM